MNTAELLIKRVKCMALYENSPHEIGDIAAHLIGGTFVNQSNRIKVENPENYPAIWKEIFWWEERTIEEMPEYIKDISDGFVYKVEYRKRASYLEYKAGVEWFSVQFGSHVLPATIEEYLAYTGANKTN